jgi:hypothetical protein
MKCDVCKYAVIQYAIYKKMILCGDCYQWVLYEDALNPEEEA